MIDPSMEGYLPIPQQTAHDGPVEVILRFSSGPESTALEVRQSSGEVFLHAVGATATFGNPFTHSQVGPNHHHHPFTTGSRSIHLIYHPEYDGCSPFTLPVEEQTIGDMVMLMDRGGCTFLEKLIHATRAGMKGLIVAGLPPPPNSPPATGPGDAEGLIRPAADGESPALLHEVENTGLVYIDWRSGDVLRNLFKSDSHSASETGLGTTIKVEVLSLDGQSSNTGPPARSPLSARPPNTKSREGRVGVGEHVICNLRIVEGPL